MGKPRRRIITRARLLTMWWPVLVLAVFAARTSGSHNVTSREKFKESALSAVVQSNIEFASQMCKELSDGNTIVSPLSMLTALGLAHIAARGNTAQQITETLHLKPDYVKAGFHNLLVLLKRPSVVNMNIANALFLQAGFPINVVFSKTVRRAFLAKIDKLDFSNNSTIATGKINKWVRRKTRRKIGNIIPRGLLTSQTRLVLVNAVYFKGMWKKQFNTFRTKYEKFHIDSKTETDVLMMHNTAYFGYSKLDYLEASLLEMSYAGNGVSMIILLPNNIDGISNMEHKLSSTNMSFILKKHPLHEVKVSLPRFKFQKSIDFKSILMKLGVTEMFDEGMADFSGITGNRGDLYVKHVIQKGAIEVNEFGTEAGVATGLVIEKTSLRPPHREFIANHPFVFFIWEKQLNAVLFMGRFVQP